jgi:hemolysin activation/secretion protein
VEYFDPMKHVRFYRRALRSIWSCTKAAALFVSALTLSAQILPPPPIEGQRRLSEAPRTYVRDFEFEGNTVSSDAELDEVTRTFVSRELNTEDLEQARRAVSLHYVNHGFVNSGAVIPDQDPENGIIRMRIIEGTLSEVELHGNRWLRDWYIQNQVRRWSGPPLNVTNLQEGLQLLRENPNVKQINAELKPGASPGESLLNLRVEDQQPFRVGLQIDNQRPPSVGEEQLWLLASDLNLTGHSDPLDLRYGLLNSDGDGYEFSGADNMEGAYRFPVTPFGTTLALLASRRDTRLVEETFADLDIESQTSSFGADLRHPIYQTANDELAFSLGFDRRKNRTWLLGERFSLSPGADLGEMVVSVLRFGQEWIARGQNNVLALRSTFSFGLDVLDATDNGLVGEPNATFFHWLGQGQYARRLFETQNELVLRVMGQWTSESLPALEQLSVGGFETVRGFYENQLVRDRGFVSSLEFRLPILYDKTGAGILYVAPFFDFGGAWNVERSPDPTTIASTGLGLLYSPNKYASAQIYWGYRLRHVDRPEDAHAQGAGIGFKININAF